MKVEATKAMKAMDDTVTALKAKSKAQTSKDIRETGSFSREDLINGLKNGQSEISGSTWQRLHGIHKGRTIKLYGGKEFKSKELLEEPAEIATDGDVDDYLDDSTSFKKYHYCYAFSENLSDIKLEQLAGKLKEETGICDMYIELKKEKQKRERSELDEITMTPLSNHHNHIDNNHKDHVDSAIQQDRP